jgi:hypothetical protein
MGGGDRFFFGDPMQGVDEAEDENGDRLSDSILVSRETPFCISDR